jgi:hypothetical protein
MLRFKKRMVFFRTIFTLALMNQQVYAVEMLGTWM